MALPAATTVTVEVGASGDSATEGTDYADVQEFTLTIPVGMAQGTATFELTPMQDTVAEGDEEVSVKGTATGFTVTGTVVTLTDDDEAPARITLTVSPEEVSEGAGATTVTVTARLVGSVVLAEATTVTVEVGAPGGTAQVGSVTVTIPADYATGHATIPGGMAQGTGTFELTPTQDTVAEGDEDGVGGLQGSRRNSAPRRSTLTPTQDTVAEGPETVSVEGEATGFTVAPT